MVTLQKSYIDTVNSILPNAQIIKCRGYINNDNYSKAKAPFNKYIGSPSLTDEEIQKHLVKGGWIGAVIPENHIVIDVDDSESASYLVELLKGENLKFHLIKSPNGMQFIFKSTTEENKKIKMISKWFSAIGVMIDTRVGSTNSLIVFPTQNTENRFITEVADELDELPEYLRPLWNSLKTKDYEFPIPIDSKGNRNTTLYDFARRLWHIKGNEDLLRKSISLIYQYFIVNKTDFDFQEVENSIKSVMGREEQITIQYLSDSATGEVTKENISKIEQSVKKSTKNAKFTVEINGENLVIEIPFPFIVKGSSLFLETEKKEGKVKEIIYVPVCRQVPIITKSFSNVEHSQLYYEIVWNDNGRDHKETISAGDLAIKRQLLNLANMSLGVTDNNAKHLITYFDRFISYNDIPREHLVERLGHIKNGFIHPLINKDVKILPSDIGENQMLEAFKTSGTSNEWLEHVFSPIKDYPKALLMIIASFTSVLLSDLKLSPFIIDLSSVTSQGKTTTLRACASVWGNEHLVSEWNLTKVSAERKSAFLNSFPILLDDTRKADEKTLQSFIYNFSGGRSKGRGSITGSQREFTWNNLMLSTGEDSLVDFAEKAGGAAARVLPIKGLPFEGEDFKFFNELYKGIEKYYGSIGVDFIKKWSEMKKSLLPIYDEYNDIFQEKSSGNEVVGRIARHYAAIIFTGRLLNDFFDLDIDLMQLIHLFDEINNDNKSTDKPMQMLELILSDLDSDRSSIFGEYIPRGEIKAIYKHKTLYLLPAYLKEFLKTEQSATRSEWMRRNISIERIQNGNAVDYHQIKHAGKKFRGVAIKPEIVERLGFDFDERTL